MTRMPLHVILTLSGAKGKDLKLPTTSQQTSFAIVAAQDDRGNP